MIKLRPYLTQGYLKDYVVKLEHLYIILRKCKLENLDVNNIIKNLRVFAKDRDWDQFHTPKNLTMALSVEASELLEQFQWLTEAESIGLQEIDTDPKKRLAVAEEIADVLLYTLRLADIMNFDLAQITQDKLKKNAEKYPIGKSRGLATKYTDLE